MKVFLAKKIWQKKINYSSIYEIKKNNHQKDIRVENKMIRENAI